MIGVKRNPTTGEYEARLGIRLLGSYKTEKEAALRYNEEAKKVFSFPILNKGFEENDSNEQIKLDNKENSGDNVS